jgi:prepilin-type N-terminal cleavage/methylation domain-containing protein
MKKAFTLIELMIVITVIGILMGVTMKFGSNRIVDLKAQSLKDKFVDNYAMVQSQNLASSYHGTGRYTTGEIIFDTTTGVLARYDTTVTEQLLPDMTNIKLLLS